MKILSILALIAPSIALIVWGAFQRPGERDGKAEA